MKLAPNSEDQNTELKIVEIEETGIEHLKYIQATHTIISGAESSSNLARYDGIRYGYRTNNATNWKEVYTKTRQEGFGYEVKKKMITGTFFLDVENMEEYYKRAEKVRTIIKKEVEKVFEGKDAISMPANSAYVCLANLTGRPAITVNETTFIGKFFEEEKLIKLAKTLKS